MDKKKIEVNKIWKKSIVCKLRCEKELNNQIELNGLSLKQIKCK